MVLVFGGRHVCTTHTCDSTSRTDVSRKSFMVNSLADPFHLCNTIRTRVPWLDNDGHRQLDILHHLHATGSQVVSSLIHISTPPKLIDLAVTY
jgi:hypothetical protein